MWDVYGMLEAMTTEQLFEWAAYSELEPFGEERADLRAGIVAAAVYNTNRSKKSDKVWSATDFLLKFGGAGAQNKRPLTRVSDWERMKTAAKSYAKAR